MKYQIFHRGGGKSILDAYYVKYEAGEPAAYLFVGNTPDIVGSHPIAAFPADTVLRIVPLDQASEYEGPPPMDVGIY